MVNGFVNANFDDKFYIFQRNSGIFAAASG
jgi:hypothetical protein